jgi:hypothetical protein
MKRRTGRKIGARVGLVALTEPGLHKNAGQALR